MTVMGVDISHHNGDVSIPALQQAGMQFCGIKAWEADNPDPMYQTNVANCQKHGMPYWAYVFLHKTDTPARMQACFDFIGPDVVLAPDWEYEDVPAEVVEDWMDAYESRYEREGMNYYGLYPPDEATPRIEQWQHWFARYNTYPGIDDYLIWQFSESGVIPGCSGYFDLNQLADGVSIDDFVGWLNAGGAPPKPAPGPISPPALRMGDSGPWVRVLQRRLEVAWLANDGDFGKTTDYVVRGFQENAGLFVDGVVGPDTWTALEVSIKAIRSVSRRWRSHYR
jgi:Glycosyl hydrolases family 25/Putative peptidoglycan binding domain